MFKIVNYVNVKCIILFFMRGATCKGAKMSLHFAGFVTNISLECILGHN